MNNQHSLPIALVEALENVGVLVNYTDGQVIHERGDAKPGLSIVKQGQVKVGNYGKEGKYCLTRILVSGETFGEFTLFADLPRTHNAEAVGDTQVIQVTRQQFNALSQRLPDLTAALLSTLAIKLHDSLELLDDIRRLALPVRVAKSILAIQNQHPSKLTLTMTQNQLSEILGVTVLSVHKALKNLVDNELITLGYGTITIDQLTKLKSWVKQASSLSQV